MEELRRARKCPPLALVVEDDKHDADFIRQAIEGAGGRVLHRYTAEDGIKALMDSKRKEVDSIDILFLDLQLGGMNGVRMLEWVRVNVPELIVIIISGHETLVTQARRLGFIGFIEKPFTDKSVMEIFEKHKLT